MNLVQKVQKALDLHHGDAPVTQAIREAERLADLYADITPAPYIVPIERFVGLPETKGTPHFGGSFSARRILPSST